MPKIGAMFDERAYQSGKDAYANGATLDDDPHKYGSTLGSFDWRKGWQDAEQETKATKKS